MSHSSSLIHGGGAYVTTVGDYVANYKEDIFDSWDNPSANARKCSGLLSGHITTHITILIRMQRRLPPIMIGLSNVATF